MSSGCVAKECRLCAIEPYSVRHDVGRCARRKAFCVTLELEESAILLDDLASFGNRLRVAASGCPERLAKDPDGHNGFVFAFLYRRLAAPRDPQIGESAILLDDLASFGNRLRAPRAVVLSALAKDLNSRNGFVFAFLYCRLAAPRDP